MVEGTPKALSPRPPPSKKKKAPAANGPAPPEPAPASSGSGEEKGGKAAEALPPENPAEEGGVTPKAGSPFLPKRMKSGPASKTGWAAGKKDVGPEEAMDLTQ